MTDADNAERICVIPGEDAAAEAVHAVLDLVRRLETGLEWNVHENTSAIGEDGRPQLDIETKAAIDRSRATLFGATGGPNAAALFYLRWGKQTFANVRPTRWSVGMPSPLAKPEGIDLVIVRENLEDAYVLIEGDLAQLAPLKLKSRTAGMGPEAMGDGAFSVKAITREGSLRVARFAFELARQRKSAGGAGRVTASAKYNMQPRTDGLFIQCASEVAEDFPDIDFDILIVDDCAHRIVRDPQRFDVMLLPNLYGDILSDAAAGLTGGLGLAASGCYGAAYAYFESAHGTAPDIAGKGIVNPVATLLSAAMLLDYCDRAPIAAALRGAIDRLHSEGRVLTPDVGGTASTAQVCEAVLRRMQV